ncbi:lariat debranching enzyme A-like [Lineus longissimus]|uniref:lariat debranching enzyme A-like n=1 Tax=Lineus longissimus TaxID=88925 RepID=UPI002B4C9EAE
MKIAVEGCCHGELDKIYETLEFLEKKEDVKVDLMLCCGDFQAVRNESDLRCMAVPPKYQKMNTFYKYYSGEKKAPVLTIFIGGNHEASNYLQELPYGGWVAPNIYYLGYANVIQYGGIRIGGLSGIYKGHDYNRGHFERPPYDNSTVRSAYHIRNVDVFRLKHITHPVDIMMSHDWPRGIYNHGNMEALLRKKSFFREEMEKGILGSPPAEEVLNTIKPSYWFSAHLHCKFAALVEHKEGEGKESKTTRFLALDKCLPHRDFLQIVEIPHDKSKPLQLELDPEWLTILKSTNHLMSMNKSYSFMPGPGCAERWDFKARDDEMETIKDDFGGELTVPENFQMSTPAYDPKQPRGNPPPPETRINSQTELICAMLGLTDPNAVFLGKANDYQLAELSMNPDEISLDNNSDDDDDVPDENLTFINSTMFENEDDADDDVIGNKSGFLKESSPIPVTDNKLQDSSLEDDPNKSADSESSVSSFNQSGLLLPEPKFGEASSESDQSPLRTSIKSIHLSLPQPKNDSAVSGVSGLLSSSDNGGQTSSGLDDSKHESDDSGAPRPKKLKRRNVALYGLQNNDS